jgi:hypothetical protein
MPIPKNKEEEYGKIIGHLINLGKAKGMSGSQALAQAKPKADKAIWDGKKRRKARK